MSDETQKALTPQEELEILHPERQLMISGELITVRELGFFEGLAYQEQITPLAQDLGDMLAYDEPSLEALMGIFARHKAAFGAVMAAAINKPATWLDTLGDDDGLSLTLVFWAVNKSFFVRRALMHRQQQVTRKQLDAAREGAPRAPASGLPA